MVRRWVYPITGQLAALSTRCDATAPAWLKTLARQIPAQLDSPSNQIVLVDQSGTLSGCVNGWESYPLISRRVTTDTRFRLASLSKLVTFFGVTHEQALGQADWLSLPLVQALGLTPPFRDPRIAEIQIRHLLNHSAGFDRMRAKDPMVIDDQKPWCPGQLEKLADTPLQFTPGARHAYANLGFCLAAAAYEKHMGRSLWSALEQDMHLSRYGLGYMDEADSPIAYNFMHNEVRGPEFVEHFDWQALRAPMGMTGSAQGLARFVADNRALLGYARGMHDPGIPCNELILESCMDGFLERRRMGDAMVWLQRGYLYGMSALFVMDEAGNFLVWLGSGEMNPLTLPSDFLVRTLIDGVGHHAAR
ncbi:serine hydrolase [Comamonas testosteroni]|nr:serine hydrolase [Comamonas testosteroni]WEE77802.1 serine hydrolase [Comamonas testosteroni]